MRSSSHRTRNRESAVDAGGRVALLVIVLLGLYAVYDATVFYADSFQRVAYALAIGPVLLCCAIAAWPLRVNRDSLLPVAVLTGLCVLPCIGTLTHGGISLQAAAADAVTFALPLGLLLLARRRPELYLLWPALLTLTGFLAVAAMVAPILGQNDVGRFQPPSILLASVASSLLGRYRGIRQAGLALGLLAIVALTMASAFRATLLVVCGVALLPMVQRYGVRAFVRVLIPAIAIGILFTAALPRSFHAELTHTSRMAELARTGSDSSIAFRLQEATDILEETGSGWPLSWLFGAGHGSSWTPASAAVADQNIGTDGTVHHVHMTGAALFLRCGIFGVFAYVLFLIYAARPWMKLRLGPQPDWGASVTALRLAALGYGLLSLINAVPTDPIFSFVLAGALASPVSRIDASVDREPNN